MPILIGHAFDSGIHDTVNIGFCTKQTVTWLLVLAWPVGLG